MAKKPEMGKYLLWQFFRKNALVRRYLPPTRRYSTAALGEYLKTYRVVYIKPVAGSRGMGILKAWTQDGKVYVKKTTLPTRVFRNEEDAIRYINRERGKRAYIVQRGLALAKVNGRVFDIRVMMQRTKPGGAWLYSGMLAKIAGAGSVVTNVALSQGTVMEVEEALRKSLGWSEARIQRCIQEIKKLSFTAAKHFDSYQYYRELGFDIAVDQNGKVWLIEENTGPSHPLFRHLKSNLSMYRTIQFRWGQYNRALQKRRKSG